MHDARCAIAELAPRQPEWLTQAMGNTGATCCSGPARDGDASSSVRANGRRHASGAATGAEAANRPRAGAKQRGSGRGNTVQQLTAGNNGNRSAGADVAVARVDCRRMWLSQVIGSGGSVISSMRLESAARIAIDDTTDPAVLTIRGGPSR